MFTHIKNLFRDYGHLILYVASLLFVAILGPFLFSAKSSFGVYVGLAMVMGLVWGYDKVFNLGVFKKREEK